MNALLLAIVIGATSYFSYSTGREIALKNAGYETAQKQIVAKIKREAKGVLVIGKYKYTSDEVNDLIYNHKEMILSDREKIILYYVESLQFILDLLVQQYHVKPKHN